MKQIILIITLIFSLLIQRSDAQTYGWVDISGNIPSFPHDTTIINLGQDTIIAGFTNAFFISDNEGWIPTYHPFPDSAAILHTTDGGLNWTVQMIESPITALEMLSANEGYAASFNGDIYHTANGGITWDFHAPTFALSLADLDFPAGSDTGYACGQNGTLFQITQSGVTQMTSGIVSDMKGICFVDPDHGSVGGQAVIKSYVYGSWVAGHTYPSGIVNDIFYTDTMNGWAAGYWLNWPYANASIIHCTDGYTWSTQQLILTGSDAIFKLFFLNTMEGWCVGTPGLIYHTIDGGVNWNIEANGLTNEFLYGVQFTSPTNGYVTGNNKTLLKYTQLASVAENEILSGIKVYPNPSSGNFQIEFTSTKNTQAKIEIINVLGEKVFEKNIFVNTGINFFSYDENMNEAGIYFLRIANVENQITQKIIIQ